MPDVGSVKDAAASFLRKRLLIILIRVICADPLPYILVHSRWLSADCLKVSCAARKYDVPYMRRSYWPIPIVFADAEESPADRVMRKMIARELRDRIRDIPKPSEHVPLAEDQTHDLARSNG